LTENKKSPYYRLIKYYLESKENRENIKNREKGPKSLFSTFLPFFLFFYLMLSIVLLLKENYRIQKGLDFLFIHLIISVVLSFLLFCCY